VSEHQFKTDTIAHPEGGEDVAPPFGKSTLYLSGGGVVVGVSLDCRLVTQLVTRDQIIIAQPITPDTSLNHLGSEIAFSLIIALISLYVPFAGL
jgi:hypothetical protein